MLGQQIGLKKVGDAFHSKRRDSETSIDTDRPKQPLRREWGALVKGSDPPYRGNSVRTMVGHVWRVPASRLVKTLGRWCVENRQQNPRFLSDGKKKTVFVWVKYRRCMQSLAP